MFELLRSMPASELAEWRAYDRIDPFGESRADLRAGMIASPIANATIGKNVYKPTDFFAFEEQEKRPMDEDALKAALMGIAGK